MMKRIAIPVLAFAVGVGLTLGGVALFAQPASYELSYVHAQWAYDIADPEEVVDQVDAVFIGTVTQSEGQIEGSTAMPFSLWTVEATESLQGDVSGSVTVAQEGGFNEEEQKLYLHEGDQLMTVGASYLLTAKFSEADGWYVTTPSPAAGEIPAGLSAQNDIRQQWVDAIAS
jgi:hypothetical protein